MGACYVWALVVQDVVCICSSRHVSVEMGLWLMEEAKTRTVRAVFVSIWQYLPEIDHSESSVPFTVSNSCQSLIIQKGL